MTPILSGAGVLFIRSNTSLLARVHLMIVDSCADHHHHNDYNGQVTEPA